MKMLCLLLSACILLSCERKLTPAEVKENLEKAMTNYLQKEQDPEATLNFKMQDVSYFEEAASYNCEFTVKLTRPDGTDTTGIIKGRISKDFSTVTKK